MFERQPRVVTAASMTACNGRVQRAGDVIHVVAERLDGLSNLLRTIGDREEGLPVPHGRADGATHSGSQYAGEAGFADGHRERLRAATRDFH